ncbi:MAG: prepilin-type N-terminal cleavage/methylation domain-containing protein [Nitrososphaera sp.]
MKNINGFTLLEMMVIAAIIGILIAVVLSANMPESEDKTAYQMGEECREKYGPTWNYKDSWCYNIETGESIKYSSSFGNTTAPSTTVPRTN